MVRRTKLRVFLTVLIVGIGTDWGNAQQIKPQSLPRGRFADPYLASHTWPGMGANRGLSLFALAAQQRAARQATRELRTDDRVWEPSRSPYHQSRPGGASAAHFFGRSRVIDNSKASPDPARYDRYRHFFGQSGRELRRRQDQS